MKDEDEESDKTRKNQVDGEVLCLVALRGEMELEFAKVTKKKKVNFVFILKIVFQL